MKNTLNTLSYLGLKNKEHTEDVKPLVLTNQINLIVLFSMILILLINLGHHLFFEPALDIGTLRVFMLTITSILNLFLVYSKKGKFARILTVVAPVLFFIYLPSLLGFVEDESFLYYPFIAIAFSIIPHLLFSFRNEKKTYIFLNLYAFIGVLLSDIIILAISDNSLKIRPIVLDFYVYYKLSHVLIYLFINLSIIHLKNQNKLSEESLQKKNHQLSDTLDNLKNTQDHLIQSEKMATLGVLISGLAHEINTPLNFIYLGMQNLELRLEDYQLQLNNDKIRETNPAFYTGARSFIVDLSYLVQSMKQGVERTNEIINSLGNYARKDANQMTASTINEEIDNALLFLTGKHKEKIEIIRNYGTFKPIKCYPGLLNQAFLNIIKNAIESIENKGSITITTQEVEHSDNKDIRKNIKIQIKDTGTGIPKDKQLHLFEVFFTTKEAGKGTGLGLFITKNIIEKHEGTIKVISEPGKGSEFIITIPAIR